MESSAYGRAPKALDFSLGSIACGEKANSRVWSLRAFEAASLPLADVNQTTVKAALSKQPLECHISILSGGPLSVDILSEGDTS